MDLRVEIPLPIPVRVHPPEETRITATTINTTTTTTGGFDFASYCSSPTASSSCYLSAPPSPPPSHYPTLNNNNFFFFYSAPTSPNSSSSSSKIPFNWEESPGVPKSPDHRPRRHIDDDDDDDFEFDFSGQLVDQPSISAADELFHAGKIRPLKPPPRLVVSSEAPSPPRSPRSPAVISKFRGAFSPRRRKEEEQSFLDPFETALERTRKSDFSYSSSPKDKVRLLQSNEQSQRGRPTTSKASSTSQLSSSNNLNPNPRPRKGISRSLSPLRVSEFALHMQQQQQQQEAEQQHRRRSSTTSNDGSFSSSSIASSRGYRKWRLKDLLLFRSASEGRAAGKSGPLKKYYSSTSTANLDINTSSFRSDHSVGSSSRRTTAMPPANNRAASAAAPEELKSRTSLPYKYGFLGCLGFNPLSFGFGYHDASRGFVASSFTR